MLQILQDGDKRLLKKSKRVDKIDDKVRNIAVSMISSMKSADGVGLSAPQVGILKRIIIVMVNEEPKVMINPEIISDVQETCIMEEGCLSFPGKYLSITRPESVTVKYRNLAGHPMLETYDGLTARIIYHEIDHLEGIVFTSR